MYVSTALNSIIKHVLLFSSAITEKCMTTMATLAQALPTRRGKIATCWNERAATILQSPHKMRIFQQRNVIDCAVQVAETFFLFLFLFFFSFLAERSKRVGQERERALHNVLSNSLRSYQSLTRIGWAFRASHPLPPYLTNVHHPPLLLLLSLFRAQTHNAVK